MKTVIGTKADKRLDGIINDAQEELTALRRELSRYQSIFDSARLLVGHEFGKPLTSISGYLDLLEERLGATMGEKERGYLDKIHDSIRRLDDLVESVVQMLLIENGAADLEAFERVDLVSFIERVRERFEEQAPRISVHVEAGVPPLLVRRRCLDVVLENLVSNALKHGGDDRPIRVAASVTKDRRGITKDDILIVTVEDHGVGIPEDKLDEIFTPFFRLENGSEKEGLGLGLALVKNVITIMKGEIHVRSKPGEGTTVTVVIPVTNATRMLPDTVG